MLPSPTLAFGRIFTHGDIGGYLPLSQPRPGLCKHSLDTQYLYNISGQTTTQEYSDRALTLTMRGDKCW